MERGCHAFDKFMLPLFFASNISSCCCQGGGAEERVRAHDKYIVLSSLFSQLHSPTLFGLLHICFIAASLYCSQPLLYIYLFSFSLCLFPLCTIPSSPSPLLLSDILFFIPSRGLRPAVAMWFEQFQVFSQQGEIVIILMGRWRAGGEEMLEAKINICFFLPTV